MQRKLKVFKSEAPGFSHDQEIWLKGASIQKIIEAAEEMFYPLAESGVEHIPNGRGQRWVGRRQLPDCEHVKLIIEDV